MTKIKTAVFLLVGLASALFTATAQNTELPSGQEPARKSLAAMCKENNILNKLDLGFTVGTTGLGFELGTPITDWARLRVGASFMPPFNVPMHFGITTYTDGAVHSGNFGKIKDLMYNLSGYEMDDVVDVDAKANMVNFKFMVDVYPLPANRHWHVTLGIFTGPRRIGKAINTMTEMPSLLAISMYNRLYDYTVNDGFIDNPIYNDIYLDPDQADMIKEKFEEYGRIGIHIGDYKDGSPYYMEPGKDGTVRAKAYVNSVRYLTALGYNTAISADKRWNISVDAGALFWGGSPRVINHEGVDMTNELINVRGKVGDYLDLMKSLKVYPILEFKLSYTFF